jgi:hypothetical protein
MDSLNGSTDERIDESVGMPTEKRYPHVVKHSLASHLVPRKLQLGTAKTAVWPCVHLVHSALHRDERSEGVRGYQRGAHGDVVRRTDER